MNLINLPTLAISGSPAKVELTAPNGLIVNSEMVSENMQILSKSVKQKEMKLRTAIL